MSHHNDPLWRLKNRGLLPGKAQGRLVAKTVGSYPTIVGSSPTPATKFKGGSKMKISKNALRNLITGLFCAGEGIHVLFPVVPLGVSTTLGLFVRAVMDQYAPAVPANDPSVVNPLVPNTTIPTPPPAVVAAMKIPMILLAFLLSSSAFAWDMSGNHFKIPGVVSIGNRVGVSAADIPTLGEDVLAALPLIDAQYSFSSPILPGSFDLGLSEAFGVFNLKPGPVGTNGVNVQSLLFLGAGLRTNVSSQVHLSNEPLIISWGAEVGTPTILGVTPLLVGVEGTFQSPNVKVTAGIPIPVENVADFAIHVFSVLGIGK